MPKLVAPLSHLLLPLQEAVHRAHRTQVLAFVQQPRPNLPGRLIHEPFRLQQSKHSLLLLGGERQRRGWLGRGGHARNRDEQGLISPLFLFGWLLVPVERRPTDPKSQAGGLDADLLSDLPHQAQSFSAFACGPVRSIPSRSASFFCTSKSVRSFWFSLCR